MTKFKEIFEEGAGLVKNSIMTIKMQYDDMKNHFEEGSEHLFQSLIKLTDISGFSKDKLAEFTNSIISISPVLESAGYRVEGISINATLPPKVSLSMSKIDDIQEETIAHILKENEEKEILNMMIKTILAIDKFQDKLRLGNFELAGFDLDIGLPPGVSLKLKNKPKTTEPSSLL